MYNLAERFKMAREKAGISQVQLAEKVGLTQQAIAKIENGVTTQPRKVNQLAFALGVTANWLLFGGDENERQQHFVMPEWEQTEPNPVIIAEIPILNIELDNDKKPQLVELERAVFPIRKEELRKARVSETSVRVVKVSGNSLYPVLTNGDMVAIDVTENQSISDGDLYALRDGVLLRVKILIAKPDGGIILRSFNKDEYPDEILTFEECKARIHLIGRVFWSCRSW
ncbi:XRE family transcriptional regulator [Serratia microhaemolytica]|uniref:XRE family transcriptional regulator n=1 Tax=Serratia microhaemolytica TaxID=2675110 RepID=UPI000FDD52BF|nr:S24 family peptidase [Serratia microhaemolytica]